MRVLVLGAYGLIGLEIVRALARAGHEVVGFGRSRVQGERLIPEIRWLGGDLRRLQRPDDWLAYLSGIDAVVNAAGALQDSARDDVALVQDGAIRALIGACERSGVQRFVQISAVGADAAASTAFLRTKAAADAALRASSLTWTILKPGLVISAGAYGGTALLRMLAAIPGVQPLVLADARIQTVAGADVAAAVRAVLAGVLPARRDYELVEERVRSLADVARAVRGWSGRGHAAHTLRLPRWVGAALARLADVAGWLGWRSPLRTTALVALENGVTGSPDAWRAAGGFRLMPLEETLAALPATLQERVFGRVELVFPLMVLVLAAFWLGSGCVAIVSFDAAQAILVDRVGPESAARLVGIGIALDLAVGLGLLWRRWVRRAAIASILVACGYLAAGSWLTPELWTDPLGPFLKVLPALALALAVAALADER